MNLFDNSIVVFEIITFSINMENIFESDVWILEVLHEQPGIFEVSKVQKNSNSDILCMKKLHMGSLLEVNTINREMSAMAKYQHENIIKIHSVLMPGSGAEVTGIVIFMEFFPDGNLQAFMESRASLISSSLKIKYWTTCSN